jgi:catechol 2,3-dioxygenase-like lactoylglutathione lyase family enzyme
MTLRSLDSVYYWTRDMDRAISFYTEVLGLELARREGDDWAEFRTGSVTFALHASAEQHPPSGTAVFEVDDLDEARFAMQQSGAVFEGEGEAAGARFASLRDPDSNRLQLIEHSR